MIEVDLGINKIEGLGFLPSFHECIHPQIAPITRIFELRQQGQPFSQMLCLFYFAK
jgi:hypothetical protein